MIYMLYLLLCLVLWLPFALHATPVLPDQATLRVWIEDMKTSPKGPFFRIRWFCHDGTILPPKPYACRNHGGGVQHGEWNPRAMQLRAGGYQIANVFAGLDAPTFTTQPEHESTYKQILLEQFLIAQDNGWILRRARFYRGAFQAEDEARGARQLLLTLVQAPGWTTQRYALLREGVRLLPHERDSGTVTEVRQLAAVMNRKDPAFRSLRNKIHSKPDLSDAERVRQYMQTVRDPNLVRDYQRLAAAIEDVYTPQPLAPSLRALAKRFDKQPNLAQRLRRAASSLATANTLKSRFTVISQLLATLRDTLPLARGAIGRLEMLDLSLALEQAHFRLGTQLRLQLATSSRRQRLQWLREGVTALYGAGLITSREQRAQHDNQAVLTDSETRLSTYKNGLDYLARVPGWSSSGLRFYFYRTMQHFSDLDPLAMLFVQDRLRGSPLLFYADVLDSLLRDANQLVGVHHQLFGQAIGTGLRGLNPGLARGIIRRAPQAGTAYDANGIYILPETTSELPPVAGILTAGEGNPLSHVQLLARNLGIPNVGVDTALLPQLAARNGQRVVLAVSPAGSVQLDFDGPQWETIFSGISSAATHLIQPDLDKLDLTHRTLTPSSQLRASDSGRIVGPKAANLGALYHHYPEAVAAGLAIPFGVFRTLLSQPMTGTSQNVFTWMVEQYESLRALQNVPSEHAAATEIFRQRLHDWILNADPGDTFRQQLRQAMAEVFGSDGTYGVFVRSDTNVEDLAGFTGAGLNLTVPHVVGFESVLHAISRVWASPFSQRAYAWRQSHMAQPQHVYPAVLLMLSVPSEKSGVMVTQDIDTGASGWLSVVVNEGVGGAVDGQAAESLRIQVASGMVRLLARATAPMQSLLRPQGGMAHVPVSGADRVLKQAEIAQLIELARELPRRFPGIVDAAGNPAPADIEFGFLKGQLRLFQLRPFLESARARSSGFLHTMDQDVRKQTNTRVSLHAIPTGNSQ